MNDINKALDSYLSLQQEIFNYFGYKQDWKVIPIDDAREYYWELCQNEDGGGEVFFSEEREDVVKKSGNYYGNEIYTQRFLPKWVYRGKDYTMICVDTHTDGNKFLQIFDNNKEVTTVVVEGVQNEN